MNLDIKLTAREKLAIKMLVNAVILTRPTMTADHYHGTLAFIKLTVRTLKFAGNIERGNRRMEKLFRQIEQHPSRITHHA